MDFGRRDDGNNFGVRFCFAFSLWSDDMVEKPTIQVQSVIYGNEKESLLRAIEALANAVRVEREECGRLGQVTLCYGDATAAPVYSEKEILQVHSRFAPYLEFSYRFFGFNSGSAKGENLLAQDSSADYIMVMNPDVMVSPRYFIEIMKMFRDPTTGAVEARQTPVEHSKDYDPATGETGWATGACTVIPTKLFRQLNGYDGDSFFMYCDDVDLSWRIRLIGYRILYQPLAPVFHAKRLSSSGAWLPTKAEKYYSAEAALFLSYKWSHPEITENLLHLYETGDSEERRKAVAAFRQRKTESRLPQPLDPEHKVAEFLNGYYAKNRFVL